MADIVVNKVFISIKDQAHAYVSLDYFIDGEEHEVNMSAVYLDKMDRLELDMLAEKLLKRMAEKGDATAKLIKALMESK